MIASAPSQLVALVDQRAQLAWPVWAGRRWLTGAMLVFGTPVLVTGALVVTFWLGVIGAAGAIEAAVELSQLMSIVYLAFVLGVTVNAVTSAGGRELYPRDHLLAYPVRPGTDHLATLLLAPLNLAWMAQAGMLVFCCGAVYSSPGSNAEVALALALGYVLAGTLIGQALSWGVELIRTYRGGRWALGAAAVLLAAYCIPMLETAVLVDLLESGPTARFDHLVQDALEDPGLAREPIAWLLGIGLIGGIVGWWLRVLIERRPRRDQTRGESRRYRLWRSSTRPGFLGDLLTWRRLDWASVVRTPPLRRALVLLLILPPIGAAVARVPWSGFPLLVGMIGASAALLFSVNAFCLDGPGATWRQTLPGAASSWFFARLMVMTELGLGISVLTAVAGIPTATGRSSSAATLALVAALIVMPVQISALSMAWSISHPFRAPLRTTRDSAAPPLPLTLYSMGLLGASWVTGAALAACARFNVTGGVALVAFLVLTASVLSLARSHRLWSDPIRRSSIVATVAAGG